MFQKISGVLETIRKKRYQNEGSSLIMVIIMISFVGVLVSISVYVAYYNFFMKYGDRSAKNSFYTVESALDEINVGLQREISLSMAECYTATSKRSDLSVQAKEDEFKKSFYLALWNKLRYKNPANPNANTNLYRVDKLTLYLDKTRYDASNDVGAIVLTQQAGTDPELMPNLNTRIGNTEFAFEPTNSGDMLILKNVSLQYRDPRGYVSMLTTDIVIQIPQVNFVSTKQMPDIENYSLIANEALEVKTGNSQTTVNGNIYGGGKVGTIVDNTRKLRVGDEATGQERKFIAKQVTVGKDAAGAGVVTLPGTQLWTEAIDVNSATISLEDKTYVKDDLTIDGRNSNVTLKGQYFGYGSGSVQAEDSSSILINGAKTTLDMSQLNNLMLMGHAFVGARHYDVNASGPSGDYVDTVNPDSTPSTDPYQNNSDFMLGQSVAVKSDQIMYMVPEECMGYEGNVQVLAKNPMTLAEHTMLTTTVQTDASGRPIKDAAGNDVLKYSVVRLDKVFEKLGKSVNAYGASYRPVYRRVDGSILVYYYLYFNSESMANEFFSDYYTADKDAFDAYIKEFVEKFSWNEELGRRNSSGIVNSPLHIAGNLVYFDGGGTGNAVLKRDTKAEDLADMANLNSSIDVITDSHQALFAKLLLSIESVATTELTNADGTPRTAYENIVLGDRAFGDTVDTDDSQFSDIVPAGMTMTCSNEGTGVEEDDVVKAMIVNNYNFEEFTITDNMAKNLYFVVASGDVRVTAREFKGVILARGKISVASSCVSFVAMPDKVKAAMSCRDENDLTNGHFAANILIDGASYLNYTSADDSNATTSNEYGYIELADLIHYENWNKK